jgi:hypothetical protein
VVVASGIATETLLSPILPAKRAMPNGLVLIFRRAPHFGDHPMALNIVLIQPLIALIAGILILIMPRLLNFIVAIYLIILGITGLWPHLLR